MGRITINGVDMREYNVYSVRKRMAMVAQDTELFTNTIEHNVAYSVDEYTEEDLIRACTLAQAHQFIQSFDDKYKSRVGKKGTRLSGGQKQRLSIARVLMRKPEVMILDEATSSLDGESEALVQAALEQAIADQQCTVIIVAHRLSTVASADKIIVIDDGQIVEQGTHNELVAEKGLYAKMVERQINLQSKARHNAGQEKNDPDKPVVPPDTIDRLLDDINQ
ncbi:ABC transporter [Reticulomyxa filosa]|uniref:ABC transporter n=1 Tax=Reticulomyxa filosa TaxID=46433 RepID=X6P5H8_RETFI|nr:ABC transporter [Reticulomyxa filosa]|eukprot:ETO33436.1 ABC transporter [Reticulomyxa filosa]